MDSTGEERLGQRQAPRFSGVSVHRDGLARYSIRYPIDWQLLVHDGTAEDATDGKEQDGVTFRPNPDDAQTFFNVWIRELEQGIVSEDFDALREGIQEGLSQLPEVAVQSLVEIPIANLLKLEIVYGFRDGAATLERKTWVIFADRWQYTLTWQGSSPVEYKHWLAMANYSFASFELPPGLMFATDREMTARSSRERRRERS